MAMSSEFSDFSDACDTAAACSKHVSWVSNPSVTKLLKGLSLQGTPSQLGLDDVQLIREFMAHGSFGAKIEIHLKLVPLRQPHGPISTQLPLGPRGRHLPGLRCARAPGTVVSKIDCFFLACILAVLLALLLPSLPCSAPSCPPWVSSFLSFWPSSHYCSPSLPFTTPSKTEASGLGSTAQCNAHSLGNCCT